MMNVIFSTTPSGVILLNKIDLTDYIDVDGKKVISMGDMDAIINTARFIVRTDLSFKGESSRHFNLDGANGTLDVCVQLKGTMPEPKPFINEIEIAYYNKQRESFFVKN